MELRIEPLISRTWPALEALFREGGDPRWCWCAYWRVRGLDWTKSTPDGNRAVLERAMTTTESEGRPAPGLVALDGDRAVGWVAVAPRTDYDRLTHARVLAPVDDQPVWSITCFVVSRRSRGRGVARALLDAAVAYARAHGGTIVEGYPADVHGGRVSAASAYLGTLPMFEAAGFEVVARRRANRTSPVRPIVRLTVDAEPSEAQSAT
jgi:GNAT superfamily N-acetyltransferase